MKLQLSCYHENSNISHSLLELLTQRAYIFFNFIITPVGLYKLWLHPQEPPLITRQVNYCHRGESLHHVLPTAVMSFYLSVAFLVLAMRGHYSRNRYHGKPRPARVSGNLPACAPQQLQVRVVPVQWCSKKEQ